MSGIAYDDGKTKKGAPEWICQIQRTLAYVNKVGVKTASICRVPEKMREAHKEKSDEWYRPKFVAMGPIHRGATIDLQTMELTKWRYMHSLLSRPKPGDGEHLEYMIHESCRDMKYTERIIRESYGDTIRMRTDEFTRIMLLDGCFLLHLLLNLSENHTFPSDLEYIDDDKKRSRLLTDLMLLENQVPFLVLSNLSSQLLYSNQPPAGLVAFSQDNEISPQKLAESLFGCDVAGVDFTSDVCHFLHLIHLCYPAPHQDQDIFSKHPLQLHRCARKLQAFGITITKTPQTNESKGNNKPVAAALREFVDMFELEIDFKQRQLNIPTLHIKEETEVRWRNFIAWEQIGGLIGVGYKFTSYAYFFKGLVCSVHDVQLLREREVIKVHTGAKDEDLLIMFQSIVTGAEHMDARYNKECHELDKAQAKGVAGWCMLILRMAWHYWRCLLEWLQRGLLIMLRSYINTYLGTPWKFIGVVSGAALLVLTIMQTTYTVRSS